MDNKLTDEEFKKIEQYLESNGYLSIQQWAADSDYLLTETVGWVDLDDNPVNIDHCLLNAIEAAEGE